MKCIACLLLLASVASAVDVTLSQYTYGNCTGTLQSMTAANVTASTSGTAGTSGYTTTVCFYASSMWQTNDHTCSGAGVVRATGRTQCTSDCSTCNGTASWVQTYATGEYTKLLAGNNFQQTRNSSGTVSLKCQNVGAANAWAANPCGSASGGNSTGKGTGKGKGAGGPAPPAVVTQAITFDITAAQYTGNVKTVAEVGYGIHLDIYDINTSPPAYKTGCSITSVAARRSAVVTFTATVPASVSAAVNQAATVLTPAMLTNAMTTAKSATGLTSVTLPVATSIASPSCTGCSSTSGAGVPVAFSVGLVAALALAALGH